VPETREPVRGVTVTGGSITSTRKTFRKQLFENFVASSSPVPPVHAKIIKTQRKIPEQNSHEYEGHKMQFWNHRERERERENATIMFEESQNTTFGHVTIQEPNLSRKFRQDETSKQSHRVITLEGTPARARVLCSLFILLRTQSLGSSFCDRTQIVSCQNMRKSVERSTQQKVRIV